ncbi:hypothetical protein [Streptomyces roseoverticillatus]|nr:hypothetical protein [Streptomyces roseoverticillatus]
MLEHLAGTASTRSVTVLHADRSMDLNGLGLAADGCVYLCGSLPFMREIR